jgi:hypothetical protein
MQLQRSKIVMAAAALVVLLLTGCAGSDNTLSSLMVAPGQYDFYHCDQLARSIQGTATRVRELETLKAKAKTGAAGQLVSTAVYEPDYLTARGTLKEMQRSAREKHCDVPDATGPTVAAPEANKPVVAQQSNKAAAPH